MTLDTRRLPCLTLLLALAVPIPLLAQAFPKPAPSDSAAIMTEMARSLAGWSHASVPQFVGLYTDSATFMTKQGPQAGRDRMAAMYEGVYFKDGKPIQALSYSDIVLRALGAEHVLMTGQCHLTGGGQPDYTCWFTLIWEKTPAGWRVIHDHSSAA